jgi:hypothetical protein
LRNQALFIRRYTPRRERLARLRRYTYACLAQYGYALQAGAETEAAAILDGWWSGLTGRTGPKRLRMPPGARRLIRRHLRRALWLAAPWSEWRRRFSVRSVARRLGLSRKAAAP